MKLKINKKEWDRMRNGPEFCPLLERAGEAAAAAAGDIARLPALEEGAHRARQAVILGGTQDEQQEALGKAIGAASGSLR